jgi:hypothetical protein
MTLLNGVSLLSWKEMVVAYFKVLLQYLLGESEDNKETWGKEEVFTGFWLEARR